ncbi:hypothetical protein Z517_08271 [Fonsecaea pedrosoi CBS 271.37]|uniref:NAD(P)-binding domain-containing protein n=1 Tax=Fonsecaea pedrosoi CBS 271.37 TaxID=1442368 RepID=A0A0D2GIT3_9EURO|nr:uncharacterized protein Z517_08271 [Fonsecaea pedrosoi CBS 271.37]KIW78435.1 hypothetical protein Z517_08271 [Fonsecaea pedrosoi CBS 271.37]
MATNLTSKSTINVLLLGATGSLGSRIFGSLLERPSVNVTVVVRSRDKMSRILYNTQHPSREGFEPSSLSPALRRKLSIIEGDATDSDLLARIMREKSIRVLVNAAGHAPMFAGRSSNSVSDGKDMASGSDNEVARIVRASVDAIEDVAKSAEVDTAETRVRGWFVGGMLLLDLPESDGGRAKQLAPEKTHSLDTYLPLYLHHRPLESILRSSKHLDWTLVCPAKMIPRSQRPKSSTSSAVPSADDATSVPLRAPSPTLVATADVPPRWSVWPVLRALPWSIGPVLEIMANSPRYTVTFEHVAEFIVASIVREHELHQLRERKQEQEQDQNVSRNDHERDQHIPGSVVGREEGERKEDEGVWVNSKIGLIACSGRA